MTTEVSAKRPRSPSIGDMSHHPSKAAKTQPNHLQINYLARQYNENIPLANSEDTLPSILRLIGDYEGVLHRHESIAGNLGACPLGPILMKRFERLFDGPPRILKANGKDTNVTWLDVVEFARNKPEQFNLEKMRNGIRVCQFYTKQCRVEISEEDYVLIASGMPQKLIPPQPIIEDEEKELTALDLLEKNLLQIISLADQVSTRARQLNHRLKNRRTAILSRRAESQATGQPYVQTYSPPPALTSEYGNGHTRQNGNMASAQTGFTAVNLRSNGSESVGEGSQQLYHGNDHDRYDRYGSNGASHKGITPEFRSEVVKSFITNADRDARLQLNHGEEDRRNSPGYNRASPRAKPRGDSFDYNGLYGASSSTVAIPSTPASLIPHSKPSQVERDDGGPYKAEMVLRMEKLHRGERVMPPCDRCRRLHMDCQKNLTACMGCTKKHAKCSWKEVRPEELDNPSPQHGGEPGDNYEGLGLGDTENRDHSQAPHSADLAANIQTHSSTGQGQGRDQSPRTTAPSSYSAEDDDITRAILEEKDDPTDEHQSDLRPEEGHHEQPAPRDAGPEVQQEPRQEPRQESRPAQSAEQRLAEAASSVPPSSEYRTDSTPVSRSYESIPRPASSSYPSRPEYYFPKRPTETRRNDDDDSDDEVDHLQRAAQEVYRSASTRPL